MRDALPNRTLVVPSILLLAGWVLLCIFAPWRQVHPSNAALGHALSRAPIWSHIYDGVPGARIDGSELFLEAGVAFLICVLLLGFFRSLRLSSR